MANPIKGFNTKDGVAQYDYNALANRPEDGTGTIISPNADYAEVGEWEDGNPASEDRLGYFVAIAAVEDNTIKIRKATSQDDVKGVTVFNPAFSGNATAEKYVSAGVLYPQYSYVGLMGIVSVIDNGACTVGGRCMPADDGTAVPSSNNMGYGVLKRINASHVLIAVEPGADMIQRIKEDIEGIENKLDDNIEANKKTAAAVSSLANQTEKRVSNLEAAVYGDLAQENEDNSLAYVKDVPTNALPFAEVKAIGGMTRKCTQVWDEQWVLGYYDPSTGTFTVDISFFASKNKFSVLPNTEYSVTCSTQRRIVFYDANQNYLSGMDYNSDTVITTPSACYYMAFSLWSAYGVEYKNDIMINKGSTALPYEPYFEGLRSAKVESVESVGANMFGGEALANKIKSEVVNATLDKVNKKISYYASGMLEKTIFTDFKPNTQYTFIFKGIGTANFLNMSIVYTDGTISDGLRFNGSNVLTTLRFVSNPSKSIKSLIGVYNDGQTTLYYDECGIFEGVLTAEDFKPYFKNTLPIPEAVRSKPWYGIGLPNTEYYNSATWSEDGTRSAKQKAKRIVLDGVTYPVLQVAKYIDLYTLVLAASNTVPNTEVLAAGYDSKVNNYNAQTNIFINANNYILVTLPDQTITTGAAANAYLQQHPIECIVTQNESVEDISDILPADNLIGVEGGGTLTFVNEYGYDVPSEVTFVTKGASA